MIHQYKMCGYNIVLDVFSGSVHVVDDVAYDIISMIKTASEDEIVRAMTEKYKEREDVTEDEIRECIGDIQELEKSGQLFSEDAYAEIAKNYRRNNFNVKAICLHVAHTCNLNCSYCFAAQGKYHGERAVMSLETGKRAIDFLIENSVTPEQLSALSEKGEAESVIIPTDKLFPDYEAVQLDKKRADRVKNGVPIYFGGKDFGQKLRIYDENGNFIALSEVSETDGRKCLKLIKGFYK